MENLRAESSHVKTDPLTEAEQAKLDRRAERETHLRFDSADGTLYLFTCHARVAGVLMRRGARPVRVDYRGQKSPRSWTFELPRSWFKTPGPPRRISAEQRQALSHSMKARLATQPSATLRRMGERDSGGG